MNHKTNGINKPDIQMNYRPQRIYNSGNSPNNKSSMVYHQKQYSDYQIISPNQNQNEKIIHRSIKRNFDPQGNAIITTKIVREIDYNDNENKINSNSIMNIRPQGINSSFQRNNEQENEILRYSNYSNNEEMENTSGMYNNQKYGYKVFSPNSFESHERTYNQINTYSGSGMESEGGRHYYDGYRSPGMGNAINLKKSEISPVLPNYTSGSDFDDSNPNRGVRQNTYNYMNNPKSNLNYSQRLGINKVQYRRYNLESPSYTQNEDFDSPDRNYDYGAPYFRNIQIDKIKGIQPIYQEKVNMMNNQIETSGEYDRIINQNNYGKSKNSAAKVIQSFYRNYSDKRDSFDELNQRAIQIQSFVRGFLVRKKVLRYITLAIYYQSFCDKIQDALVCHVREEVFKILKNKLGNNKYNRRGNKDSKTSSNRRKNHISTRDDKDKNNIDNNDDNTDNDNRYFKKRNRNNESKGYELYKSKKYREIWKDMHTPPKYNEYDNLAFRGINRTNRSNRYDKNICKKNSLNYSVNYTTNHYGKFDYTVSPTKKVTHYFISSPCSHNKPHQRFYQEIDGKSTNIYRNKLSTYRSYKNINDINSFKNYGKTGYYKYKYENNTSKMFQDKPDYTSGIGTRSYSRGLFKTTYTSSNQNIHRCNCLDDYRKKNVKNIKNVKVVNVYRENDYDIKRDIHTHKFIKKDKERNVNRFEDDEIESDNYLSLNIVKIPHRRVSSTNQKEEIITKTVETKEYVEDRNRKLVTEEEPKRKRFSIIEMNKAENVRIMPLIKKQPTEVKSKSLSTRDIFTNTTIEPNKVSKLETINIAGKKKEIIVPKIDKEKEKRDKERVEIEIERRVRERVEIEKREIDRIDQERKEKERQARLENEKRDREREKRDKEKRDQENLILIEKEKKIKIQQEELDRDREDIKRKELEIQKMREIDEKNRKNWEEQNRRERERRLKEDKDRREREKKDKEKRDQEMEQMLIIEKEKIIKIETERIQREMREQKEKEDRLRREREAKLKKEKEERERLARQKQLEDERKEKERRDKLEMERRERERREEQLRIERERKRKEEQDRIDRERREKERKDKEDKLRKEREDRLRKEKEERERIERERRLKEDQERRERERKEKERKDQLEREKRERERREEQIRIERERKIRIEQERIEREKREKEAQRKKDQEEKERLQRIERTKIIERDRLIRIENYEKERQERLAKRQKDKEAQQKREDEYTKKVVTTTTKKITTNIKQGVSNLGGTDTKIISTNRQNLQTVKVKEGGGGGKYPYGPGSEYILKKDCQENLNRMKLKLEQEYEKKIEMERKRGEEELRRNQENWEKKNKKEIERLMQLHKQQDTERIREIEREKEIVKKREIELEKLKEKEMRMGEQIESDKQRELQRQREIDERNRKNKLVKVKKEIEINLRQVDSGQKKEIETTTVVERDYEKDIMRAKEILRIFILSRCDPLVKKRKHFNVWRRKARLMQLLEYSKVIQAFCRTNLGTHGIRRVVNNWRNLSRKLYYKTRVKILRMRPKVVKKTSRKKKLYELLRITKLTTLFSRRRFIHFIILVWHIYAKNIHRKRANMKYLYENLLKTYMNLANDIFGNNQIENPSVQDAMYEAVNTNKFITLWPDDVPLAKKHYEEMRKMKSVDSKGNKIFKSTTTTKYEVEKKGYEKKYYMGKVNESVKEDNTSEVDDTDSKLESQRRKQTFLEKYRKNKSYNRDYDKRSNLSYTDDRSQDDKSSSNMGKGSYSKYGYKYESKYDKSKDPRKSQEVNYIVNKYVKTEGNSTNINNVKDSKTAGSGSSSKYTYTSKDKNPPYKTEDKKTYSVQKTTDNGQYKTQYGNNVNVIYSSNIKKATISSNSSNTGKYESKYVKTGNQKDNKDSKNININIKTTGSNYSKPNNYDTYQKKVYVKTTTEQPKTYSKKVETKTITSTTGNVKSYNYSFNKDDPNNKNKYGNKDNIKDNRTGAGTQLHKSNTEGKLNFAYKSQYTSGNTSNYKDGGNKYGSKYETKIYEKKIDSQPYRNVGSSQDSKNVTVTKSYSTNKDGGNKYGSKYETKIYEKKVDSQPYRSNVGSSQDSKNVIMTKSNSTNKDGGNKYGSTYETKIYEKKVDSQPYRSNVGSSQESKKVIVTKSYTSTRYNK